MHKGVILLTKADNEIEAKSRTEEFLEGYGNGKVWDWYVIGGRWSGNLNNNAEEFFKKAKKLLNPQNEGFISMSDVDKNKDKLQKIWENLGEESTNPYSRRNSFGPAEIVDDDIVPAKDCRNVLKGWYKDMKKEAEKFWKKTLEEREKEIGDDSPYKTSSYYAGLYSECSNDEFTFESNIFNIDEYTNSLPKSLKGYYAVMVDMHN